jgi:integrase/recombinase XerD
MTILGKGNRYRRIELEPKTVQLIRRYIANCRLKPKPLYKHRLFINQRGEGLTRHGIYCICKKHLHKAFSLKRLKNINPVHSFRHSCAVNMLLSGKGLAEIKNRLGHDSIQSTTLYTHMDLTRKREVQKTYIEYMKSNLSEDPKINEWIDWENRKDIMEWLDSL